MAAHYALMAVPLGVAAGVERALLLKLNLRGTGVYRAVFFLRSVLRSVATAVVFLSRGRVGVAYGRIDHFHPARCGPASDAGQCRDRPAQAR